MSPTSELRGRAAPAPDPRVTLIRDGVAAASLEGVIPADRYLPTTLHQVAGPTLAIRKAPDPLAEQVDQLLFGETFEVLVEEAGWAFGQASRDGYVGYVQAEALRAKTIAPTHWVSALRTYAFSAPSARAPLTGPYSMNALMTVEDESDARFAKVAGLGFVPRSHLTPIGVAATDDPAALALQFLGAPYQWGGRESVGIDCSGLIQQAFYACGLACPRDSDMQAEIGSPIDSSDLRRNDLVFWKGHVGIMLDGMRLLHANGFHMATAVEPVGEAIARIEAAGNGPPTGFRRP
jgi:cell wall-associated NlpC family hydrolase